MDEFKVIGNLPIKPIDINGVIKDEVLIKKYDKELLKWIRVFLKRKPRFDFI